MSSRSTRCGCAPANGLAENWRTIPHVFQAIEVDFTALDRVRQERKEAFRRRRRASRSPICRSSPARPVSPSQAFPLINARFADTTLIKSRDINLGIAVDLSHNGLVVPVVRDAGDLALIGLAKAMNRQIEKARAGKLTPTISPAAPIRSATTALSGRPSPRRSSTRRRSPSCRRDAIRLKPAVVSTPEGDFIAPRMIGMIGQSFDHRAFDGAYSAAFLSRLKRILEERELGRGTRREFLTGAGSRHFQSPGGTDEVQ